MADTSQSQASPDAAEKAYAEAAEKVVAKPVEAKPAAPVTAKAEAPVKPVEVKPVTAKPVAAKPVAKKAPVKKVAAKKPALKSAAPAAVKTKPVRANPVRRAAKVKKAPAQITAKPIKTPTPTLVSKLKDSKMATTTKKTADAFTTRIQDAVSDAQARAKTAFEKSQAAFGDAGEFNKGNLEAIVESGKILAQGLQSMGKSYAEEMKSALETVQADVKELTAVKTPTEFFQLQAAQLRKRFDHVVAYNSKNAEAALKLANDAFQPISNRVTLAVEKVRKAA